jgi:3-oxoacyl-[acyl-carrier protein] reductase
MKILITGASRGIGKAIALALDSQYALILHATSEASLQDTWNELPHKERHTKLCADFTDAEAVKQFCNTLKKEHGNELYAVINNAGLTFDKALMYQGEADIDKMLQVNLKTPIQICKTAVKLFYSRQEGVIINISSCVGEMGNAFQAVYSATKAGLVAFSKSLAREIGTLLPEHNIRVLSLSPGFIETDMTNKIPEADKAQYLSKIPSRKFGQANEVAHLVSFLLSPQASYINGSEIKINGGLV